MKKIILLAQSGDSTNFVFNYIRQHYPIHKVIIERPINPIKFYKNRIKKLGIFTVFGQILFQTYSRFIKYSSKKRHQEIINQGLLNPTPLPLEKIVNVPSINSDECLTFIKNEQPDIVIVNGTRIIAKKLIDLCPFIINTHTGITPNYRGVHGGYWALVNNEPHNCGVTVHRIDAGVDTGGILFQDTIQTTPNDNFATYPLLQYEKALPLLKKSIEGFINDTLVEVDRSNEVSKQYYHPTLLKYFKSSVL